MLTLAVFLWVLRFQPFPQEEQGEKAIRSHDHPETIIRRNIKVW